MTRLSIRWYTHSVTRPHTHSLLLLLHSLIHSSFIPSNGQCNGGFGHFTRHYTKMFYVSWPSPRRTVCHASSSYLRRRPVWQYVIYSRQFSQKIKISFFFSSLFLLLFFSKHVLNSTTVNNVSRALFNSCCCCCCCCYFCFCCFEFFSLFFWLLLI